ncbi:hypothetical protein SCHPADRAFT_907408 [Schizopora paradoxa]|uniref:MINDY deubiquitinase domain-containing protein n=1 Tax=Schizopora paradoxa TaxID=27342 RepID=A0A0H2RKA3_9AGAM|nr:hypothetical protein SCHPADRAFT_907408 [Schizopora paradoxa]
MADASAAETAPPTEIQRPAPQHMSDANAQALRESREGVWFLKTIVFQAQPKKIITQNYNGPCSFIAICNILILRGDIEILPPERTSVSYEFLSQLVGEYLLRASPEVDLSAALTMMPLTQKGMDLNPLFTSHDAFRPAGDAGALKLFEQARIKLVHGWLVDPGSPEHRVISTTEDYDNSVNLIVAADDLTRGQLVTDERTESDLPGQSSAGPSNPAAREIISLPPEDQQKVEDAIAVRNFLDNTSSQLTYHGLFTLISALPPGSLVALFRNSHLSVLYKRPRQPPPQSSGSVDENSEGQEPNATSEDPVGGEDSSLYSLVTDVVFLHESSVVWERLEDVDGGSTSFVDADFIRSSPAGGDFAGHTAESALRAMEEAEAAARSVIDPAEQALNEIPFLSKSHLSFDLRSQELARQLQAEEDARSHELYAQRQLREHESRQRQIRDQQQRDGQHLLSGDIAREGRNDSERFFQSQQQRPQPVKMKKDKSCVIM